MCVFIQFMNLIYIYCIIVLLNVSTNSIHNFELCFRVNYLVLIIPLLKLFSMKMSQKLRKYLQLK
jgi:hypothetical protein